jgi:iron complex transport system permease protein
MSDRRAPALTWLVVLAVAALGVALASGSGGGWRALWDALATQDSIHGTIVWDLRLPRALTAFAVGGLLAVSGAVLQALLRNPLADPYVLGISGGAAIGALAALAAGAALPLVQVCGAAGALVTLALLFGLARRALFGRAGAHGDEATTGILLTGVMIAAFCSAGLGLVLTLAPEGRLRSMVFWLLGDLAGATSLPAAVAALAALVLLAALITANGRRLNQLLRGDVAAFTQGVDVQRTRRVTIVAAAAATGVAVTLAGAVGFVGFVAPHVLRLWLGNDQRVLLPAAALGGGALVVLADTIARSAFAPLQLPVGVLTAMIGVPVFLWLLRRQ